MIRALLIVSFVISGCISEAPLGSGDLVRDGGVATGSDATNRDLGIDGSLPSDGGSDMGASGVLVIGSIDKLEVRAPIELDVQFRYDDGGAVELGVGEYELKVGEGPFRVDELGRLEATEPGTGQIEISAKQSTKLIDVSAELDLTAIEVGYKFACVVTVSGRIWCWGANDEGQLGRGTRDDSRTPAPVDHTNIEGRIVEVSCGRFHCNAVDDDGLLYGWGASWNSRVGFSNVGEPVVRPTKVVTGGVLMNSVSAGDDHSCGLTTNGNVACWGSNENGQTLRPTADTDQSFRVVAAGIYSEVSAGALGTCAIRNDGTVQCAGQSSFFAGLAPTQVPVTSLMGINLEGGALKATAIAVGEAHACAISSGMLYCWGDSTGIGDSAANNPTAPIAVTSGFNEALVEVDAARRLNAVKSGEVWYTFGEKCDGDQATGEENSPSSPRMIAFGDPVEDLARGRCHTCLIARENTVFCAGEAGLIMGRDADATRLAPMLVPFAWTPVD